MAKYSVKDYARAFALAAKESGNEAEVVKNFLSLIAKNGDAAKLKKILAEAEKLVRADAGLRKLTLETARPLTGNAGETLQGFVKKNDVLEEKVVPELVAGVRITIDDERQFDASLAKKLQRMFA